MSESSKSKIAPKSDIKATPAQTNAEENAVLGGIPAEKSVKEIAKEASKLQGP